MPAHVAITQRSDEGVSTGSFARANLAGHVGDEPSAVGRNRHLLRVRLGVPALAWMHQVHGRHVEVVDGQEAAEPTADALVTCTPGVALAVLVADCLPVLMTDAVAGVAAAVHAGRSGLAQDVVTATVEVMVRLGAEPARVQALLGPCICAACYEVPLDMHDAVCRSVPAASARSRQGTWSVDLRAGVSAQLESAGVNQRTVDPRCTAESVDCFSFRRDGITGRFAGLAWVQE